MKVAILTVGEEVLAGDTENTNASWLARRLTADGATVQRILTIPDDRALIAETVGDWADRFDAVIVTGGLGGTHDDVTVDALADAFDRDVAVEDAVRQDLIEQIAEYRDADPETIEEADLTIDIDAWAALPVGSRALVNPEGLCPGCVIENVYAFPGVPQEMQALFESVAGEFGGDVVSRTLYTPEPEASLMGPVAELQDRFESVTVGSYPDVEAKNRIKVSGTDPAAIEDAVAWLRDRVEVDDLE